MGKRGPCSTSKVSSLRGNGISQGSGCAAFARPCLLRIIPHATEIRRWIWEGFLMTRAIRAPGTQGSAAVPLPCAVPG